MKKNAALVFLAGAAALLLPLPSSVGQEGGGEKVPPTQSGSGIKASITQVEGRTDTVDDIQFFKEQLGILSLTKVASSSYVVFQGRATVTIPIRKIKRIDLDGETVRIMGTDGGPIIGELNKETRFFLKGRVSFGDYEVDMAQVKSVEFTHPAGARLTCENCNRLYNNPEWKFCPIDGARLKSAE